MCAWWWWWWWRHYHQGNAYLPAVRSVVTKFTSSPRVIVETTSCLLSQVVQKLIRFTVVAVEWDCMDRQVQTKLGLRDDRLRRLKTNTNRRVGCFNWPNSFSVYTWTGADWMISVHAMSRCRRIRHKLHGFRHSNGSIYELTRTSETLNHHPRIPI